MSGIVIIGWICRRCRAWLDEEPDSCPECLGTSFVVQWETVPYTERQAEQLLTGQEP